MPPLLVLEILAQHPWLAVFVLALGILAALKQAIGALGQGPGAPRKRQRPR